MTVFLGGGFAAKYLQGGGNFSVPLQWMLGLRRLKQDAIWLEHLPSEGSSREDQRKIDNFQRQLRAHGLGGRYCLLYQKTPESVHDLDALRCIGISKRELRDRLSGPNVILNLSYSIHPPLLLKFERRIFCDLDPSEIIYWMTRMEMGRVLDDRIERQRSGLQTLESCSGPRVGRTFIIAADTAASTLENILSTGGYQTLPTAAASSLAEVHHDRTMVLERGGRSRRPVSRSVEEVCLRTISRSA